MAPRPSKATILRSFGRKHLRLWPSVARVIVCGLGGLLVVIGGCSFGEGTTPDCDPTAAPTSDNACEQVSRCDDGRGYPRAEEGCCVSYGNQLYEVCAAEELPGGSNADFRTVCDASDDQLGCCVKADTEFNKCLAGELSQAGSGGAGQGGAGQGGAGQGGAGQGGAGQAGAGGS